MSKSLRSNRRAATDACDQYIKEIERLRAALTDMLEFAVDFDDERLDYISVQIDRSSIQAAREALEQKGAEPRDKFWISPEDGLVHTANAKKMREEIDQLRGRIRQLESCIDGEDDKEAEIHRLRAALEKILNVNGNNYEMYVRMFAREALERK